MKKYAILWLVLIAGISVTSCNKSVNEPAVNEFNAESINSGPLSNADYREALFNAMKTYVSQDEGTRGAGFLPVFFTQEAFYVLDETGMRLASFSTDLDANDFLRENPDGTYTVHIVSDNATSELVDYSTYDYYIGNNGHMVMNYSGPAELIGVYDWEGNLLGYIYFVVYPNDVSPATVWHGHGPVRLFGQGPELNLVGKLTASAKWKNVKTFVELY
jgi:hypothetical protein